MLRYQNCCKASNKIVLAAIEGIKDGKQYDCQELACHIMGGRWSLYASQPLLNSFRPGSGGQLRRRLEHLPLVPAKLLKAGLDVRHSCVSPGRLLPCPADSPPIVRHAAQAGTTTLSGHCFK